MTDEVIYGQDVQVFLDGVLVACGMSISLKSTRKEIPTTCAGTGDTETAKVGKMKHTFSIQGIWRVSTLADVATNVTAYEMWQKYLLGNTVTIEFKTEEDPLPDEAVTYVGVGYIKDMGLDGSLDEAGKVDCSGFLNTLVIDKEPITP